MNIVMYCQFWNPFWCLADEHVQELQKKHPEIRFVNVKSQDKLRREVSDAEIFFGYQIAEGELAAATNLKWIHVPAANVYGFIRSDIRDRKILLTNSRGIHARPIAEHVIGSMLVFSRKFLDCWRFQQQHHYGAREILNNPPPLSELQGKTVFILGLGSIGLEIALLCKAFGMRVLASKRHADSKPENVDELYLSKTFRDGLPLADYFIISAPRTDETEELIGEPELALLKPECVIINIARANVIQQEPLLRFLREQRIRGAALDVFTVEPLSSDSELFSLPNVFLTPHVSGVSTKEHWPRLIQLFEQNLQRFLSGQPLLNIVDLEAGY